MQILQYVTSIYFFIYIFISNIFILTKKLLEDIFIEKMVGNCIILGHTPFLLINYKHIKDSLQSSWLKTS